MDKQGKKIMAQVCDKLSVVVKQMAKDCKTKKQKDYMAKEAKQFKALGKIFRGIKDE